MPKMVPRVGRDMILSVKGFCEDEKTNRGPLIPFKNVIARTAAMTGVSIRTVGRIISEHNAAKMGLPVKTEKSKKDAQEPATSSGCADNTNQVGGPSKPKPVKSVKPAKPAKRRKKKLAASDKNDDGYNKEGDGHNKEVMTMEDYNRRFQEAWSESY